MNNLTQETWSVTHSPLSSFFLLFSLLLLHKTYGLSFKRIIIEPQMSFQILNMNTEEDGYSNLNHLPQHPSRHYMSVNVNQGMTDTCSWTFYAIVDNQNDLSCPDKQMRKICIYRLNVYFCALFIWFCLIKISVHGCENT